MSDDAARLPAGTELLRTVRMSLRLNAPRERVSDSLELRLDHQIGKLESRFLVRSANVDGRRNELVLLRVTRNF